MEPPKHRAVDHVVAAVALDHRGQRLQLGPTTPVIFQRQQRWNAVPLATLVRQTLPLRTRPGDAHHAFEYRRLSRAGRQPRPRSAGNSARMSSHFASDNPILSPNTASK